MELFYKFTPVPGVVPDCGNDRAYIEILKEQKKVTLSCRSCGFVFEIFAFPPADRLLSHGDIIVVGQLEFFVIHTPGHSASGISFYSKRRKLSSPVTRYSADLLVELM